MDISVARPQRFDIGDVVSGTFGLIRRNAVIFLLLGLLLTVLPTLLYTWAALHATNWMTMAIKGYAPPRWYWILSSLALNIAAYLLQQAAMVRVAMADLDGRRSSIGECLSGSLRFILPLLVVGISFWIIFSIAFLLLIVPALIFAASYSLAVPVTVIERVGVSKAFSRSAALTRGHLWSIFALFVVFFIAFYVVEIALAGLFRGFGVFHPRGINTPATFTFIIISPLIQMVSNVISQAGLVTIYNHLRAIKEGIVPQSVASVFD